MKAATTWSYAPYRPPFFEVGDIYICRIAHSDQGFHFEWLPAAEEYEIYYRVRGEREFILHSVTRECFADILGLTTDTDYEFYVASGELRSRVRLVRTGESIGTVVNYLHPDDKCYSFSGRALCSPSLVRHPDGYLLASMDLYAENHPQNLTLIFRSDDEGESWHYVSELFPSFWGSMFIHRGELYMLSATTEYGDLQIGKSTDGGRTFSAPVTICRGSNGKGGNDGMHKNPQNVVYYGGRLYTSCEWGSWSNKELCHAAMVMSCDENADLLDAANWSFSEPIKFDHFAPELRDMKIPSMTIEGTVAVSPEGELYNVMRFAKPGHPLAYKVNTENPEAPLTYSHLLNLQTTNNKFMIKYDEVSGCYFTITCRIHDEKDTGNRNLLSLFYSRDMTNWELVCDLYDFSHRDRMKVGLQYVCFLIEGDDIIYLCRTALNEAHNFHDANMQTFHRIKNFRDLIRNK